MRILMIALFLTGCAEVPIRVSTHAMYQTDAQRIDWFKDGPDLVVTVHNDTDHDILATVECVGSLESWIVKVPAHKERSAIGRVMNKDVMAEPCHLANVGVL